MSSTIKKKTNQLQRFLFEDIDIRGEIVQLDDSWTEILSHQSYPEIIQQYLGEMMAATVLLAATLKIDGSLSIQASGTGSLNLMITECRNNLSIRAIAKYKKDDFQGSDNKQEFDLSSLLGDASLVITIEQTNGQRYQGIVAIKGNSIASMLENHLLQSEQLKTKIVLACNELRTAGLLLQELPHQSEEHLLQWQEVALLADTLTTDELLSLDSEQITYRLFNQHDIRQFDPEPVFFKCSCSQQKVSNMLLSLDYKEAQKIIHQSEFIEVACEFCNHLYRFDELTISKIFSKKQKPTYH
ncbi:MAG: Hsp33 family molecular chaperone HslO [Pseudomonadota bacterium]